MGVESEYTQRELKQLVDRIKTLSRTEHEGIFRMLSKHNINFTENGNGCFVNLSGVPTALIKELFDFVNYCIKNQKEMEEYDKKLNECKLNNTLVPAYGSDINIIRDSVDVAELIAIEQERKTQAKNASDIIKLVTENQHNEKLQSFLKVMSESTDRIHKKKMNSRYTTALKTFSRKCVDRKTEFEGGNCLQPEPYN